MFAIHIGYGKVLYNTYLGKVAVVLRSLPIGGLTFVSAPRLPFYHLRFVFTYLAGPFVHLVFLLGMGPLWLQMRGASGSERSLVYLLLTNWLIANLVILVANLLPRQVSTPYGQTRSDGGQILNVLFPKLKNMEDRLARYYAVEAAEAARQDRLVDAERWIEQGLAQYPANSLMLNAAGLELLRSSLEKTDTTQEKASTMCYIAIGEARLGNQVEAQRYVRAARLLDPTCPFLERAVQEAGMESSRGVSAY